MPRTARIILPAYPHHIIQRGQLTGGETFMDEIESRLQRRVKLRGRGRPRKERT
jgi:hypothetical protein